MSIFAGARKCDLKILAEELGEKVDDSHKLKDLKKMILASKEYDEECAKKWLNTIINERKEMKKFRNVGLKKRLQNENAKKKFKLQNENVKKRLQNGNT
ncbi:hypothetical protein AVEN_239663-1 [Araneus ventricosus]|uniref:Uncharacterized protein n=1 Tax=Araneus ventricosus TaxID=182803 RepID=A0A4Y2CUK6_ARAVE|nr:hypothetical protein AVEN_239663-1 [Araneus ventricosus]